MNETAMDGRAAGLTGVPRTMLWTMHDRASAARRPGGVLTDPDCVRIHDSIAYDYASFGPPVGVFALRAARIDAVVRGWLRRHPRGFVVSLGEGLETQALRVDNGTMRWLSVDLPEAIAVRERFIPPTDRFRHCAASAWDSRWMAEVDRRHGVLIIAQGLLMYFAPAQVRQLLLELGAHFPGQEMVFDTAPPALSRATRSGATGGERQALPAMHWGLGPREVRATLRRWCPGLARIRRVAGYHLPTGRPAWVEECLNALLPYRNDARPSLVHVRFR